MTLPTTHKVFRLSHLTDISGLVQSTEPIPQPGKHELLLRVNAVSLNYRDIAIATSKYPFPCTPGVVPCSDMSGTVAAVGPGVKRFSQGDRVVVAFDAETLYGPRQEHGEGKGALSDGVLREYIVVLAASVINIPPRTGDQEDQLNFSEWSCLPCTGVTAWNALYGNVALRPGQTVLCLGTGGVSITALILAKAAGATVIITSSSDEKLRLVKGKWGADHTINYTTHPDWSTEVLRLTHNRGADHVIENGGSGTIAQSLKSVAFGGVVSLVGFLSRASQEDMPDVAMLAKKRNAVVRAIMVGSVQQLQEVVRVIGERGLKMPVEKTFDFDKKSVREAYQYVESGQHIGKVVIKVA